MALKGREKYSAEKIEKLHEYLKRYHQLGQPIDYEILVDGFRAVRRTNDPEVFYQFDTFVNADTQNIEIVFYQGSSNNNERFLFLLTDTPIQRNNQDEQSLSGIEIQNRILDGINKERERWEMEKLLEEKKQLEKDNADYEAWIGELEEDKKNLEEEITVLKAGQNPLNSLLGELGSSFVTGMLKKNPGILKALPGGETLSGFISETDDRPTTSNEQEESTVKVKPKAEPDAQDKEAIEFIKGLQHVFSQEEFIKVMQVLDSLASDKNNIDVVIQLLTSKAHETI